MANRRTGAQSLSRLYTVPMGGAALEKYPVRPEVRFRAYTGSYVSQTAARALSGSAAEFEQMLLRVWESNTSPIAVGAGGTINTGNVRVTSIGMQPAALAVARGEAIAKSGGQLSAETKVLIQRMLEKYVEIIRGLAEEVVQQIVYTPKGEAVLAASAYAARSRFKNYTASDAGMLMKRYQYGQSNIIRRRYPYYGTQTATNVPMNFPELEIGRRIYTGGMTRYQQTTSLGLTQHIREYIVRQVDPSLSLRGRQFGLPMDESALVAGKRSLIEKAWYDTRPGFQEKLQRGLQMKSHIGLSILFQAAVGLAGLGAEEALGKARNLLRAPYYERTFTLRDAVIEGVKRVGGNILIGVDESVFARAGKEVYWHYVEEGHKVVIPRPSGRGRPGEYEMHETGNFVEAKPFMETLFTRVKTEILPLIQEEMQQLGIAAKTATMKFIQSAKVSDVGRKVGLGVR